MCLIATFTSAEQMLPAVQLDNVQTNNPDGMGVAYIKGGRVRVHRHMTQLPEVRTFPAAIHWRYGTSGHKNKKNCHPFWVLNEDWGDPYDLVIMHNGVLPYRDPKKEMSDTACFASMLRRVLKRFPEAFATVRFRKYLSGHAASHASYYATISNRHGIEHWPHVNGWKVAETGAMCSNLYSLDYNNWRATYARHGKGRGNFYGGGYGWIGGEYDDDFDYVATRVPSTKGGEVTTFRPAVIHGENSVWKWNVKSGCYLRYSVLPDGSEVLDSEWGGWSRSRDEGRDDPARSAVKALPEPAGKGQVTDVELNKIVGAMTNKQKAELVFGGKDYVSKGGVLSPKDQNAKPDEEGDVFDPWLEYPDVEPDGSR